MPNYTIRRDNGNRIIWEQSQIEDIVNRYKNKESCSNIGKIYGVTRKAISNLLRKKGIKVKTPSEFYKDKFPKDSYYFDKIDCREKAYWLGFLYADGCISCGSLIINLQQSDKEHLELFKQDIKAVNNNIIPTSKGDKKGWSFSIRDSHMLTSLRKLGMVERKSLILTYPTIEQVPEEYNYDFIRGYFDGDGTISFDKRGRTPQVRYGFCGTKEMLLKIQEKIGTNYSLQKRGNAFAYVVSGNKVCKNFFDKIYDNPTRYLNRKYELYQKFLSYSALTVNQ